MLYEESNDKNHKLQAENETLMKLYDLAKKVGGIAICDSDRLKQEKKALQVTLKEQEERLTNSEKDRNNLIDDLLQKDDELKGETRKLRELDEKYNRKTENHIIEVRELKDKIRELEVELDSIYHHENETNSDHYNEDQFSFTNCTYNVDSNDATWDSGGHSEESRKRRRVVEEREYYSDSEEEKPRRSVFSRLGKKKIKNK